MLSFRVQVRVYVPCINHTQQNRGAVHGHKAWMVLQVEMAADTDLAGINPTYSDRRPLVPRYTWMELQSYCITFH